MNRFEPRLDPDLLLRHTAWMRTLANGLLEDEARADDVVQEACLAAIESPPREPRALSGWLRQVVSNLAARSRRSEVRRRRREERAARPEELRTRPEDVLERAELHRQIVEAVLDLAEPYRSTVLLRYFEDLRPGAIARRQGIPVATVKARLHLALRRLRGRLERLDAGHTGRWRSALVLLAGRPGSATAVSASTSSGAVGSAVTLGGIMTMKTVLAVSAGVLVALALGFGLGSRGKGRDQAMAAFDLVERRQILAAQGRLADAEARLNKLGRQAAEDKMGLAARIAALEADLAAARAATEAFGREAAGEATESIQEALQTLSEMEVDSETLWTMCHAGGNLDCMEKALLAIEQLYPLQLAKPELSADERDRYKRALDFNGFRKGYTRLARGDLLGAREALARHIEWLDAQEAALKLEGLELSSDRKVYRGRSRDVLRALEDLGGRPAPADLSTVSWVTERQASLAKSKGQIVALIFRTVNDNRSGAFLNELSSARAAGEVLASIETVVIAHRRGVDVADATFRAELARIRFQGAAGFETEAEGKYPLFAAYHAMIGSATLLILDRSGQVVWFMQDPRWEDLPLVKVLLRQAAQR